MPAILSLQRHAALLNLYLRISIYTFAHLFRGCLIIERLIWLVMALGVIYNHTKDYEMYLNTGRNRIAFKIQECQKKV